MKISNVLLFHTSHTIVASLNEYFSRKIPEVNFTHFVDEQIIDLLNKEKSPNSDVKKMLDMHIPYFNHIEIDAIQSTCTSISQLVNELAASINKPIFSVDDNLSSLVKEPVNNPLAIYTIDSTIEVSRKILADGVTNGKQPNYLFIPEALKYRKEQNIEMHNRVIIDALNSHKEPFDAIFLQQASTLPVLPELQAIYTETPVYHSLDGIVDRFFSL
jgi:hypothetical protein